MKRILAASVLAVLSVAWSAWAEVETADATIYSLTR